MPKKKTQKKEILTEEILRLRLIPIEQYSSITVGAAELLAIKGAHKFDNYDDYDESSLDWLKELPDDAALKLGKSKTYYTLSLNGLNSLSDKGAEALSKFIGEELYLNGLTALSENGARALAKFKGKKLSLNGLATLSDKAAQALASFKGQELSLNGATSLTDMAVEALANLKGDLLLDGLSSVSDAAAAALGAFKGKVSLLALSSVSDTGAISLNNNKSIVVSKEMSKMIAASIKRYATGTSTLPSKDLTKIRQMIKTADPKKLESACNLLASLNASEGDLLKLFPKTVLFKLLSTWNTDIWNILAALLKTHKKANEELYLQAKKRLTGNNWAADQGYNVFSSSMIVAANSEVIDLLSFARDRIFYGSSEISDDAAFKLTKYKGIISFELSSLSENAAKSLTKRDFSDAYICLSMTNIKDDVIFQLAKINCALKFTRLKTISEKAAQALSKHQGNLSLNGLTELSDAAAEYLSRSKATVISLGLKEISDTAAEALSKYGGELDLQNLRASKLSDAAAESLSKCKGHLWLSHAAEKSVSKKRKK